MATDSFEIILTHHDPDILRVIVVALKAHGFHPHEGGSSGLPGLTTPNGAGIMVPKDEAGDAKILAGALLEEMSNQ